MGSLISKITKNKYKTLYETELHNRKMYEQQYKDLHERYVNLQKEKGMGELRKKLMELADENEQLKPLKAEVAKLKLEIEDLKGFLSQETLAKEYLLRERNKQNGEQN